jgi:ParB-like chromosome segregation protein Spo0J
MSEVMTIQQIEHVRIDALEDSTWSPNEQSREVFQALKLSIRQSGLVDPPIVRGADNSIIGGHHRVYAIKELLAEGWVLPGGTIPVIYLDVSEEEAKRLNLALNKITGEPNLDKLGELLRELRDVSDADELAATGYSPQEIDDLVTLLETDRDALLRSIDDATDADPDTLELAFRLTAEQASVVGNELDRIKETENLTGKDADGMALVEMATRSAGSASRAAQTGRGRHGCGAGSRSSKTQAKPKRKQPAK